MELLSRGFCQEGARNIPPSFVDSQAQEHPKLIGHRGPNLQNQDFFPPITKSAPTASTLEVISFSLTVMQTISQHHALLRRFHLQISWAVRSQFTDGNTEAWRAEVTAHQDPPFRSYLPRASSQSGQRTNPRGGRGADCSGCAQPSARFPSWQKMSLYYQESQA